MNNNNHRTDALNISDPFVFSKKTPYMQRIGDLVRSGHTQYVIGTIPPEKAGFFAAKMESTYHTHYSTLEACRARQNGEASARLLFLHQPGNDLLTWVLLHHPGMVDDTSQKWRDATDDKIALTGYELVRRTRPGSSKPAWTWRYTEARLDMLRNAIIQSIRGHQDVLLLQTIHSLSRSPGFAGVREQVQKLYGLVSQEWKRRRAKSEPVPEIPRHGYTRRVEDKGCRLTELRQKLGGRKP